MRLFFALLPDGNTRAGLASAAAALRLASPARLVADVNHHVTVAFVGELAESNLPVLRAIGRAQRATRFTLQLDAYEYWPKPEVVVGAARVVPAALAQLWQGLHTELAAHRWALQPKRLRPHVTLARKVTQPPVLQAMSAFDWPATEFSLMRSDTGGTESAYTVVDTWPLLYECV